MNNKLTEVLNEKQQKLFEELCEEFLKKSYAPVKHMLWKLCYNPAYLKERASELYESIPEEQLQTVTELIREELRARYAAKNQLFTFGILHKNDTVISNGSNVDGMICDLIYEFVEDYIPSHNIGSIERLKFLLDSEEIKNYFGGLRELGFNCDEASFICNKVCCSNIATLVEKLYGQHTTVNKQPVNKKEMQATNMKQSVNTSISEEVTVNSAPKLEVINKVSDTTISASSVLSNVNMINAFYEALDNIIGAGFSAEELIEKRELVSQLLEAASKFSA